MKIYPTLEETLDCQDAFFEWCVAHDTKDWDRLRKCVAPALRMDYGDVKNDVFEVPSEQYVQTADANHLVVTTQHLIGGVAKWEKTADEIKATFQIRVAKVKWRDQKCADEVARANAHGVCTVPYRKIDGVWKVAGLKPHIAWVLGDPHVFFGDVEDMSGGLRDGEEQK